MKNRELHQLMDIVKSMSVKYVCELIDPYCADGMMLDTCEQIDETDEPTYVNKIQVSPNVYKTIEFIRSVEANKIEVRFLNEPEWVDMNSFILDDFNWGFLIEEIEDTLEWEEQLFDEM